MKPSDCILGGKPQIGDYVITYNTNVGLVVNIYDRSTDAPLYEVFLLSSQKCNAYTTEDVVRIDKTLVPTLVSITPKMHSKLVRLVPEGEYDYLYNYHPTAVRRMALIDDYVSNNLTIQVQDFILSDGIKRIVKREKGKGNRIVELYNGEVWKVHRIKNKTSSGTCRALKQYKNSKKVRNHTTHYELIEKLC